MENPVRVGEMETLSRVALFEIQQVLLILQPAAEADEIAAGAHRRDGTAR